LALNRSSSDLSVNLIHFSLQARWYLPVTCLWMQRANGMRLVYPANFQLQLDGDYPTPTPANVIRHIQ
jgi:hypothetical protein